MAEVSLEYIKQLEETIGKFLKPIEGVPLTIVVKAMTGHITIPWVDKDLHCAAIRGPLSAGLAQATKQVGKEGSGL